MSWRGMEVCWPPRPSAATSAPQSREVVVGLNGMGAGGGAATVTYTVRTLGGASGGETEDDGAGKEVIARGEDVIVVMSGFHVGPSSLSESSGRLNEDGMVQAFDDAVNAEVVLARVEEDGRKMVVEKAHCGPSSRRESAGTAKVGSIVHKFDDAVNAEVVFARVEEDDRKMVVEKAHCGLSSRRESAGTMKVGSIVHKFDTNDDEAGLDDVDVEDDECFLDETDVEDGGGPVVELSMEEDRVLLEVDRVIEGRDDELLGVIGVDCLLCIEDVAEESRLFSDVD